MRHSTLLLVLASSVLAGSMASRTVAEPSNPAETVLFHETFDGFSAGQRPTNFTAVRPLGGNRGATDPIPAPANENGPVGAVIVGPASSPAPSIGHRSLRLYDYASGTTSADRANLEQTFSLPPGEPPGLIRLEIVFRRSVPIERSHEHAGLHVSMGAAAEGQTLHTHLARAVEVRLFNDGTYRVAGTGTTDFQPFEPFASTGVHTLSMVANHGSSALPYQGPDGSGRVLSAHSFDVFLNDAPLDLNRGFRSDENGQPIADELGKFGLMTGNALDRTGIDFLIDEIRVTSLATPAEPIVAPLWLDFLAAREAGEIPTLPDFSYAGYHYSEKEVPRRDDLPRFDVSDFGAIPDDDAFDDDAIQAAIDAAEAAGGGIVFFPPGRFLVSPVAEVGEEVTEGIRISSSNIILRGSGTGDDGTVIHQVERKEHIAGYMFRVAPPSVSSPTLASITAPAPRGSYAVSVSNPAQLTEGLRVLIAYTGTEIVDDYFAPLAPPPPEWERLHDQGLVIREIHTVDRVEGNTVFFREPLHFSIPQTETPFVLRRFSYIEEVGIEGIRFRGNWDSSPERFDHHKNDFHDYAWNAIRFENVGNSWIQDLELRHWSQGLYFDSCAAITVRNVRFTGKQGHMSIHTRRGYGILIHDCVDEAGQFHGPGLGYSGAGTVYLRHEMRVDQRMDSHSGTPYATLFDDIQGGILAGNGGPLVSYPHHGRDLVFWNFAHRSDHEQVYDFWSVNRRNSHTFALPSFVGFTADNAVTFLDESSKVAVNESFGRRVRPASLFEAQLQYRLGRMHLEAGPSGRARLGDGPLQLSGAIEDLGLPAGSEIDFAWEIVESPGDAGLQGTETLEPVLTFSQPGLHRIRLTATSGDFQAWTDVRVEVVADPGAPWEWSDVGEPEAEGSAWKHPTNGYILEASGSDIWGNADAFHFLRRTVEGDFTVEAELRSLREKDLFTKGGIMIRSSLAPDASNLFFGLTSAQGLTRQIRATDGGPTVSLREEGLTVPRWIRVERSGDTIRALHRANVNEPWTEFGEPITFPSGEPLFVGFAATSRRDGRLTRAEFAHAGIILPGSYGAWRELHFSGTARYDDRISGPVTSGVGGRPNFYYYALALPPTQTSTATHVRIATDPGADRFGLRFDRPIGFRNVEYTLEKSDNLIEWKETSGEWKVFAGTNADHETVHVYPATESSGKTREFLRLRIRWTE